MFVAFDAEAVHLAFDDPGVEAAAVGGQQVAGYLVQTNIKKLVVNNAK